jgi:phosphatidylethanolamine/phosphatidyl-N-methylethanolamine N-methyltransferase
MKTTLADGGRFLRQLFSDPRRVGAIAPSGPGLARAMAAAAASAEGWVVELGPGTGSVTLALLESGIASDRLAVVEYDVQFCRLLRERFAGLRVIQGDAFKLSATLADLRGQKIAAVVSSLPLLNEPPPARARLLDEAFSLMGDDGVYVQFTYGLKAPIAHAGYDARRRATVLRNLPPAHVWVYRRQGVLRP